MLVVAARSNHPLELAQLVPEPVTNSALLLQLQPAYRWIQSRTCSILNSWPSCTQARMAGRGGAARPNGPAAGNKICQFKLVLLGESAVGKSSLVLRFVKGQFHEYQESTIGGECQLHVGNIFFINYCTFVMNRNTRYGQHTVLCFRIFKDIPN